MTGLLGQALSFAFQTTSARAVSGCAHKAKPRRANVPVAKTRRAAAETRKARPDSIPDGATEASAMLGD